MRKTVVIPLVVIVVAAYLLWPEEDPGNKSKNDSGQSDTGKPTYPARSEPTFPAFRQPGHLSAPVPGNTYDPWQQAPTQPFDRGYGEDRRPAYRPQQAPDYWQGYEFMPEPGRGAPGQPPHVYSQATPGSPPPDYRYSAPEGYRFRPQEKRPSGSGRYSGGYPPAPLAPAPQPAPRQDVPPGSGSTPPWLPPSYDNSWYQPGAVPPGQF